MGKKTFSDTVDTCFRDNREWFVTFYSLRGAFKIPLEPQDILQALQYAKREGVKVECVLDLKNKKVEDAIVR